MTIISGTDNSDTINQSGAAGPVTIFGLGGDDHLTGSGFSDDFLLGDDGNDSLFGGPGGDNLRGGPGADLLSGGAGPDQAFYDLDPGPISANLSNGTVTDGYGTLDTLISIELLRGSSFNDTIIGGDPQSDGPEVFNGRGGSDLINGGAGFDRSTYHQDPAAVSASLVTGIAFDGWGGIDTLVSIEGLHGSQFNDTLIGGNPLGNAQEIFEGRGGNDFIEGGVGTDRVSFLFDPGPVSASILTGLAQDGYGGTDTFSGIEQLFGSAFGDTLVGSNAAAVRETLDGQGGSDSLDGLSGNDSLVGAAGNDTLLGGSGNDTLRGDQGSDSLIGGLGQDEASYQGAPGPIVANTATGIVHDGYGSIDTLIGIERIQGAAFGDTLIGGNPASDYEEYFEGLGGNDSIDGGSGTDIAVYLNAPAAVHASLATGIVQDGHGGIDTLVNVEVVSGSAFDDTLIGSDFVSFDPHDYEGFVGNGGNDLIDGAGGRDRASYTGNPSGVLANLITGIVHDGFGDIDTLIGIEVISGSDFGDTLIGGNPLLDAFESFVPRNGADLIDGGRGIDQVSYWMDEGPVAGSLALGRVTDGGGSLDTLIGIENLEGSEGADTLEGDAGPNEIIGREAGDSLAGLGGGDTLLGQDGNDSLSGGDGQDWLAGGNGNDLLRGDAGLNVIDGGAGADTVSLAGSRSDYQAVQIPGGLALLRKTGPVEYHVVTNVETVAFQGSTVPATVPGTETVITINGLLVPTTAGPDFLIGGPLNDSMPGGGGDDILLGLDGDDVVTGDAGNDLLADAGTGNDSMTGGDGADVLFGFDGADTLVTGNGDDFIQAGGGADLLVGGPGIDALFGEEGDDWILGGDDLDFVIGGPGADALDGGDGNDRVHVSRDDILAYGAAGIFDVLVPEDVGGGFHRFDLGSTTDQNASGVGPVILGFEAIDATIATGPVSVVGGSTEGRGNVLIASFFDDTLIGSDAADIIIAGPGSDVIAGGAGNDTIHVDAGDDTAAGGAGADEFFYSSAALSGAVIITDFGASDVIALPLALGLTQGQAFQLMQQVAGNVVMTFPQAGHTITLTGVDLASLSAANIHIVF